MKMKRDKSPQTMAKSIPQTKVKKLQIRWKSPQREENNPKIKPIIIGKDTEQVSPQTEVKIPKIKAHNQWQRS